MKVSPFSPSSPLPHVGQGQTMRNGSVDPQKGSRMGFVRQLGPLSSVIVVMSRESRAPYFYALIDRPFINKLPACWTACRKRRLTGRAQPYPEPHYG